MYAIGSNERTGNKSFPKAQIAQAVFQEAPIKQRIAIHCRKAILHEHRGSNPFLFICVSFPNEKCLAHE